MRMQLSEVMEQLKDAQEEIRKLKNDYNKEASLQEAQLATAEEEIKQLKQTHSNMTTTLQTELKEAHARENTLKV